MIESYFNIFVGKNAELIFLSNHTDNRDYHTEMNGYLFREWLENTLIPSLEKPSCLVMDNASYHNVIAEEDRILTSSSTKDALKIWLRKENIAFNEGFLKPELLSLVQELQKIKIFHIDKLIQ
jgi:hypothetical protein